MLDRFTVPEQIRTKTGSVGQGQLYEAQGSSVPAALTSEHHHVTLHGLRKEIGEEEMKSCPVEKDPGVLVNSGLT